MADRVPDDGSRNAPIVLIGEAPGHYEHVYGRPFVGPSYTDRLLPWWRDAGLSREQFYITNVLDRDPIAAGYHGRGLDPAINYIPEAVMRAAIDALHDRLAQHEGPDGAGPVLIVPTGNYALYALTGKGRVSFHNRDGKFPRPGIQAFRGSVLSYEDRRGRRIKVIPTVHPAATMPFRTPGLSWVCQADWRRIARDATFRELRLPVRNRMVSPSAAEVVEYLQWTRNMAVLRKDRPADGTPDGRLACSLDVETPKRIEYATKEGVSASEAPGTKCRNCGHTRRWHAFEGRAGGACNGAHDRGCSFGCMRFAPPLLKPKRVKTAEYPYLDCVGYSWDPALSLTVPTTLGYWQDPAEWELVRRALVAFHADPNIDFFGQNFLFDAWWCAEEGMPLDHLRWDLMKMHRVQRPWSEWHDLAFQSSLDTREPYWKDEAKDPDSVQRYAQGEALHLYNGTDNCVQRELLPVRIAALRERGRLEYYEQMEAPIDEGLLELSRTGIRVDDAGRCEELARVQAEAAELAQQINAAAGVKLVGKTAVSNEKMKAFLYGDGVAEAVYERPMVPVETAAAKCTGCGHARSKHNEAYRTDDPADAAEQRTSAPCIGVRKQPCTCTAFIAPLKLGKKVKVGETRSGGLRLPEQYAKNSEKAKVVSVNVVALKRLMERFPGIEKLQAVGTLVLRHRRLLKIASFLSETHVSADGRWYAFFKQDTLLGRLSSSDTPKGEGANLQNIDRKLRRFFLPDAGEEHAS